MGKADYAQNMRERIQELGFAIGDIRQRMTAGNEGHDQVELAAKLAEMEARRTEMERKLEDLQREPDGTWSNLRAEFEQEWSTLVQDFEERIGHLP